MFHGRVLFCTAYCSIYAESRVRADVGNFNTSRCQACAGVERAFCETTVRLIRFIIDTLPALVSLCASCSRSDFAGGNCRSDLLGHGGSNSGSGV